MNKRVAELQKIKLFRICFSKLRSLVQLNALIQLFNAFKNILHEDTAIERLQYQKYKTLHDNLNPFKVYLFGFFLNFGKYQKLCPLLRFLKILE